MTLPAAIKLNPNIIKNPVNELRLHHRNALLWKAAGIVSVAALAAIMGIVFAGAVGLFTLSTTIFIPLVLTTISMHFAIPTCAHKHFKHQKLAEVEQDIVQEYVKIKEWTDLEIESFMEKNGVEQFKVSAFSNCTQDNLLSLTAKYLYFKNLAAKYPNEWTKAKSLEGTPLDVTVRLKQQCEIIQDSVLPAAIKAACLFAILRDPNQTIEIDRLRILRYPHEFLLLHYAEGGLSPDYAKAPGCKAITFEDVKTNANNIPELAKALFIPEQAV